MADEIIPGAHGRYGRLDDVRRFLNEIVTLGIAIMVIIRLEVVQIHQAEGNHLTIRDSCFHGIVDGNTAGQPG